MSKIERTGISHNTVTGCKKISAGCKNCYAEIMTRRLQAIILGFCSWASILIEVKTSLADFKKDANKKCRKNPTDGVGEFRYFLCPAGLIIVEMLPENWGLLYYNDGAISIEKKANWQNANLKNERSLLLTFTKNTVVN